MSKQEFKAEPINKTKDGRIITIEGSINSVIGDTEIIGFSNTKGHYPKEAEQNIINERTIELESSVGLQLEELKMVELKKKIQDLENELKNASKKNAQIAKSLSILLQQNKKGIKIADEKSG